MGKARLFDLYLVFRMFFQPLGRIGTSGGDGAALGADLIHRHLHQLACDALAGQGGIHKSVVDAVSIFTGGGEGDLRHQGALLVDAVNPGGGMVEFHTNHLLLSA